MIWTFLGAVLGLTVMSGAVLGAALGLTGDPIALAAAIEALILPSTDPDADPALPAGAEQDALAAALGLKDRQSVSAIELGERKVTPEELVKAAAEDHFAHRACGEEAEETDEDAARSVSAKSGKRRAYLSANLR